MVDKEIIENLCVSIRGYLKELMDAQDIEWEKFVKDICVPFAEAFLFVPLSGTNKK